MGAADNCWRAHDPRNIRLSNKASSALSADQRHAMVARTWRAPSPDVLPTFEQLATAPARDPPAVRLPGNPVVLFRPALPLVAIGHDSLEVLSASD